MKKNIILSDIVRLNNRPGTHSGGEFIASISSPNFPCFRREFFLFLIPKLYPLLSNRDTSLIRKFVLYTRHASSCLGVAGVHTAESQSLSMLIDGLNLSPTSHSNYSGYIYPSVLLIFSVPYFSHAKYSIYFLCKLFW